MKLKEVISVLEKFASPKIAEGFDNVGLLIGDKDSDINKILVCLDCDFKVVNEAISLGVDLIVSHHPLIFSGIKNIINQKSQGSTIIKLIENKISLYSMHTNLDSANGGLNDYLAKKIGLCDILVINDTFSGEGLGRVGNLEKEMKYSDFIDSLKQNLNLDMVKFTGDAEDIIKRVGLCTGAGYEFSGMAYDMGADVYISGDIKYHDIRDVYETGKKLIDAGHFETEIIVIDLLTEYLIKNIEKVDIHKSKENIRPYNIK